MRSKSGRYYLTYNGELYNHRALRPELEGCGVAFDGHGDTEVLLAALETWGVERAVERFNGMFAFALWDRQERALHLVRDPFGIKPLYYGKTGKALVFASELKPFRQHPDFRSEIDRDALCLLLRHNAIPAPHCIYKGVAKQIPGTILTFRAADNYQHPVTTVYWSLRKVARDAMASPFSGSKEEAAEQLDVLLRDAVKLQMMADVPVGIFLSGGVDSSLLTAVMQAQRSSPVKTFSIGFHEQKWNEAGYAQTVAQRLGTDHSELYITVKDAQRIVPRLPEIYDEPFADSSQIPTCLVSELARRTVTVSLSGDGADEMFGGYWRYCLGAQSYDRARLPLALLSSLGPFAPAGRRFCTRVLNRFGNSRWPCRPADRKLLQDLARSLDTNRESLYQEPLSAWTKPAALVPGANEPVTAITDRAQWIEVPHFAVQMMYLDQMVYLPDDLLAKVDRASMHFSLEARVPFLDPRVVSFAWSLPLHSKIDHGERKVLLRRVLYRYLPAALADRRKMGFAVPLAEWLRVGLRDWAEELLDERRLRQDGFFHPGLVRREWEAWLQSDTPGRSLRFWSILMFQAWLDHNRKQPPAADSGAVRRSTGLPASVH
jgi:asparagine synthase (glutamine-hydrolysing)